MDIYPAIDLLGGRCVRLIQGRYDRVIEYDGDPLEVAGRFRAAGAAWIHVIDLDGARDGRLANLDCVQRIVTQTGLRVQFGGGIRDDASVETALAVGAARVIIGTRALQDWQWFERMAHTPRYDGKLALGLDARLGKVAINGWTASTEQNASDVATAVNGWPLAAIIYTDIGRDGLLLGPNLHGIAEMARLAGVPVIASGGVADLDDVRQLAHLKLAGLVIGRALYERTLRLEDALNVAREGRQT